MLFLVWPPEEQCMHKWRYRVVVGEGDWQRDPSTDDVGRFRPGDGPEVRSRSIASPQKEKHRCEMGLYRGRRYG